MKKSMCAKWFEIKLWKKLIILFPITFIIIFVTLFETTPVNLNASNISEIYIGMHSMMTDDIITGKASIKGREDVVVSDNGMGMRREDVENILLKN